MHARRGGQAGRPRWPAGEAHPKMKSSQPTRSTTQAALDYVPAEPAVPAAPVARKNPLRRTRASTSASTPSLSTATRAGSWASPPSCCTPQTQVRPRPIPDPSRAAAVRGEGFREAQCSAQRGAGGADQFWRPAHALAPLLQKCSPPSLSCSPSSLSCAPSGALLVLPLLGPDHAAQHAKPHRSPCQARQERLPRHALGGCRALVYRSL